MALVQDLGGEASFAGIHNASKLNAAGNAAAAVTVTAVTGKRILAATVTWSYSAAPTGGKLTVTGSGTSFEVDITTVGPGTIDLMYACSAATDLVVTLAAGGGTVVGKVNVAYILVRV